ncbi:MAG: hypothetical protein ACRC20_00545 [Segniliparus sp.]|uniref:hypothetical protein n=1 Tax=Segniliparus sp. TaxID=2804064 RepID=UPI003F2E4A7E
MFSLVFSLLFGAVFFGSALLSGAAGVDPLVLWGFAVAFALLLGMVAALAMRRGRDCSGSL